MRGDGSRPQIRLRIGVGCALACWAAALVNPPLVAQSGLEPGDTSWVRDPTAPFARIYTETAFEFRTEDCLDKVDVGRFIAKMEYFSQTQIGECAHTTIEEILERNEQYVEYLKCMAIWERMDSYKYELLQYHTVADAILGLNPIPDDFTDLLGKVGSALDVGSFLGGCFVGWEQGSTAEEHFARAEAYREQYYRLSDVLRQQKKSWTARKYFDPDCPPRKPVTTPPSMPPRPVPPTTDPTPPKPPRQPPPPRDPPAPPETVPGHHLFRCDMDITDPILGHLVFCTEYDSERIGSQPTAQQLSMSAGICSQAGGVWSAEACATGWKLSCITRKGTAHFYYEFVAGAPESQCERWKGVLSEP